MDENPQLRRPFQIGFLLIDGFALMSYAAATEPLRAANLLGGEEFYRVVAIPAAGAGAVASSGARIIGGARVGDGLELDLLLVVAGGDPMAFREPQSIAWLRALSRRGVRLGGVSGGPVVLARAGLMAGRRMTAHWEHLPALAEAEPELMIERSLYVIDRDRVTCAGGVAPMDMMHALIAERHGSDFARAVSDWFLHTEVRPSGGPQRAGLAERHGVTNRALLDAIAAMENRIADPINLAGLAQAAGVGPRQLNRLFRDKLGTSAIAFYRDLRLEKARALLTTSPLSMTEIALATGFSSSAHFAAQHRARHGGPPSGLRKRRSAA